MTSVYVEAFPRPFRPMIDVKNMFINVIDTWETPESEHLLYPTLREEGDAFCRFLNIKLQLTIKLFSIYTQSLGF